MALNLKKKPRSEEAGSALTEAAIILPILILIVYWAGAMTDVMILKIKSQEAARFALWEMTVFRTPSDISADVATRFNDLKSPEGIRDTKTGLILYPQAADIGWTAVVNPKYEKVSMAGNLNEPTNGNSTILNAFNAVMNSVSRVVDSWTATEKFNTYGSASATVTLTHAQHRNSPIMNGGDFTGHIGSGQDLAAPNVLKDLTFQTPFASERPLRLVYDTWKAWPKPAAYTTDGASGKLVDTSTDPQKYSYPMVESMVSQQVNDIAFFGLGQYSWFNTLNQYLGSFMSNSIVQAAVGGDAPSMFATGPMDHKLADATSVGIPGSRNFQPGPITILPVATPDVGWVPGQNQLNSRLGDIGSKTTSITMNDDTHGVSAGADQSRYTVPYRVNTRYWAADGATTISNNSFGARVQTPNANIATNNKFVVSFACRGHYFAGSTKAQITDRTKRYGSGCAN